MKKVLLTILTIFIVLCFGGCSQVEEDVADKAADSSLKLAEETQNVAENVDRLPFKNEQRFTFSSGAGGWGTYVMLKNDGTFSGYYMDSDMGNTGKDYPKGICHTCEFTGKFGSITKESDTEYSMELTEIKTKEKTGKEWIKNQILYIAADPYGLAESKKFVFYTPDALTKDMSDDFLNWGTGTVFFPNGVQEKLGTYGIYNTDKGYGFFVENIEE